MAKYLDSNGIAWLWRKISSVFVKKDGDKVLSDNNYTTQEKEKLAGLEPLGPATTDTLGGVKIGDGISVDAEGVISTFAPKWEDVQNTPTTLSGYGITDAASSSELSVTNTSLSGVQTTVNSHSIRIGTLEQGMSDVSSELENHAEKIEDLDILQILNDLQEEDIPDTTSEIVFTEGEVSQIIHRKDGETFRTDVFTFGPNTIEEIRTLATGQSLTIVTNTETLETTTTYHATA